MEHCVERGLQNVKKKEQIILLYRYYTHTMIEQTRSQRQQHNLQTDIPVKVNVEDLH